MEFLKKVYHAVAAVLLMLVTSLIYGGYILEWRGKRPLCILIAAMAVTAVLIALVCRYLKKYAGQIAVVCIVPMTFCLATGLYKLYMVAADSRSIFYLVMIFFAAAYFITEYLLNLCMENASLQNIRQFFNTHKWVLILIFIAVLCRVPLLSQLPRWDSGEYYYRLILGTHHFEYTGFKEFVENYALFGFFAGSHRCYTDQPDSDDTGAVVCVPHILKNPAAGYRRKSSGVYIFTVIFTTVFRYDHVF